MTAWDPGNGASDTEWEKVYRQVFDEWTTAEPTTASSPYFEHRRGLALRLLDRAATMTSLHSVGRPPTLEEARLAMMTTLSGAMVFLRGALPSIDDDDLNPERLKPLAMLFSALSDIHDNNVVADWLKPRKGSCHRLTNNQKQFRLYFVLAYRLFRQAKLSPAAADEEMEKIKHIGLHLGLPIGKSTIKNWAAALAKDPEFLAIKAEIAKEVAEDVEMYLQFATPDRRTRERLQSRLYKRAGDRLIGEIIFDDLFLLPQTFVPPLQDFYGHFHKLARGDVADNDEFAD